MSNEAILGCIVVFAVFIFVKDFRDKYKDKARKEAFSEEEMGVEFYKLEVLQDEYDIPQEAVDAIKAKMLSSKKDIALKYFDVFATHWKSRHAKAVAEEREAARNDKKD